ncbi:MAG TPA: DUF87 domain-containing protein [Candidatus Dormibacteraeota bacterium]|nr:DUF87 domain-containing protein [Candidatus Dormibacteraeota bacterium]
MPETTSAIRVPLAFDTQVRIPVAGLTLTFREAALLLGSAGPAWLAVRVIPMPFGLAVATLLIGAALTVATLTREGLWIGTWWALRGVERWLPRVIREGVPVRAATRPLGDTVEVRGLRRPLPLPTRLQPLARVVRVQQVLNGLFEVDPGGWRAIIAIAGPTAAVTDRSYFSWTQTLMQVLTRVDVPAQVVAVRDHWDATEAEAIFDRRVSADLQLVPYERRLFAEVAERSLNLRHYIVWAPGTAGPDGLPVGGPLGPLGSRPPVTRLAAASTLATALRTVAACALTAQAVPADDLRQELARAILGTSDAVAAPGDLRLGTRHLGLVTVTKLPPMLMPGAVISAVLRTPARSTTSFAYLPVSTPQGRRVLTRQRNLYRYTQTRSHHADTEMAVAQEDLDGFIESVTRQEDTICRIGLTIAVEAPTREGCAAAVLDLRTQLATVEIRTEVVTTPGFWPLVSVAPGGAPLRRGLILTSQRAASCLVPILGTPLADVGAPYIGMNCLTGSPAYLNVFDKANHNLLGFGTTGSGKSVTLKTLLARHVLHGASGVILDPESEYELLIRALGGTWYELGHGAALNPLKAGRGLGTDAAAVDVVRSVLAVMAGDQVAVKNGTPIRRLSDEDQGWLYEELQTFFHLWVDTPRTRLLEPTLSNLCQFLELASLQREGVKGHAALETRYRAFLYRLRRYTQGHFGPIFDRPSSFEITPGATIGIGLVSLARAYRAELTPAMVVVVSNLYAAMAEGVGRTILLIDEAHHLTQGDQDAAQAVSALVRKARKYQIGVWMASQKPKDFLETELGTDLSENAATKIVLGMERTPALLAQAAFGLTDLELSVLTPDYEPGRAVVLSGSERAIVQIDPGDHLLPIVRTGREAAA